MHDVSLTESVGKSFRIAAEHNLPGLLLKGDATVGVSVLVEQPLRAGSGVEGAAGVHRRPLMTLPAGGPVSEGSALRPSFREGRRSVGVTAML